jgi:hypothetical protein
MVENLKKEAENIYNMLGGRGKLLPFLDSGGQLLKDGAVYAHAGEVVKDSGEIKDMIYEAVQAASGGGGGRTILEMVIPGKAMADAIDRRVDVNFQTEVRRRRA